IEGLGRKMRKIGGGDGQTTTLELVVQPPRHEAGDEEMDDVAEDESDEKLAREDSNTSGDGAVGTRKKVESWWHTYKYRPILGMVPISVADGSEGQDDAVEVVLVERPIWDIRIRPAHGEK
ncbi:U3 small nucleolar RNA-associated protein, partial [Elasticomyces elasticus]